jgi:hypothetical protein
MSALTDEDLHPIRRKLTPEQVEQRRQQAAQIMRDASRAVSTLEEWQAWTVENREPNSTYPTMSVVGELADQIRRRLDAKPDAPVRIIADMYDMTACQVIMNVICDGDTPRDACIARDRHGDYDWDLIRAWLEGTA